MTDTNTRGEPRCPVCRHFLNSDNTGGWICDKRGGCGSEWEDSEFSGPPPERLRIWPEHAHAWSRHGAPGRPLYMACVICGTRDPTFTA